MKELLVRTGTSILFVLLLVGGILWHPLATAFLFLLFTLLSCHEFQRMSKVGSPPFPNAKTAYLTGAFSYLAISAHALQGWTLPLQALPLLIPLLLMMELPRKDKAPFQRSAVSLFAPLFFGTSFALLNLIRDHAQDGAYFLVGLFALIWTHDAGAYLFGRILGEHKLWPRISPGKSWEGSISGALVCIGMSWLLATFWPGWGFDELGIGLRIGLPCCVILFGTMGDLSISLLKRSLDLKDTGHIFPGHGGVLDRFDALLMCSPAFYFLMELLA